MAIRRSTSPAVRSNADWWKKLRLARACQASNLNWHFPLGILTPDDRRFLAYSKHQHTHFDTVDNGIRTRGINQFDLVLLAHVEDMQPSSSHIWSCHPSAPFPITSRTASGAQRKRVQAVERHVHVTG